MEFWFGIGLAAVIGLLLGLLAGVAMVQPRLKKIKRRWQESSSALSTLQIETDKLNERLAQSQAELANSQTQLASTQTQLAKLTSEVASLSKEKEVSQNELVTIRNSLNQISQEKERLFFDLVSQRGENDKLRAELETHSPVPNVEC